MKSLHACIYSRLPRVQPENIHCQKSDCVRWPRSKNCVVREYCAALGPHGILYRAEQPQSELRGYWGCHPWKNGNGPWKNGRGQPSEKSQRHGTAVTGRRYVENLYALYLVYTWKHGFEHISLFKLRHQFAANSGASVYLFKFRLRSCPKSGNLMAASFGRFAAGTIRQPNDTIAPKSVKQQKVAEASA